MRIYYVTGEQFFKAPHPPAWWTGRNLLPWVNPYPGIDIFAAADGPKIEPIIAEIAAASPPGFYVETWCSSPARIGPFTAMPDAPYEVYLANVRLLGEALRAHGGGGLIWDAEYYPGTVGGHGGAMLKGCWPAKNADRGAQLVQALGHGLTFGVCVWAQELHRQPGLASFLRKAFQAAGKAHSLVLGEDYVGGADPARARALGARYLHGVWPHHRGQGDRADWIWDPDLILLG